MAHSVGDFARRDWQASLPSGFEFWLKIFGVAFGLGVVSGIVMAFELGTK
jgi:cytochrome bd-type quinol oxidase subunit 1